jgi:hypothetical protein
MSIEQRNLRSPWAWIYLVASCTGVLVISALYFLSPPEVVAANLLQDLPVAQHATLTERGFMPWIGVFGLVANPAGAIGAFGLAQALNSRGSERQALASYWLATAGILFVFVDLLVGFGLPAAARGELAGFAFAKHLFDALTGAAAFAYGLSAVFMMWPSRSRVALGPRTLERALLAVGAIVAIGGVAVLLKVNAGLIIGLGFVLLTVLYGALSLYNLFAASAASGALIMSEQSAR